MAHSLSTSVNNKDDCSSGGCPVDKSKGSKLVRATELPITGNPYPPRDVVIEDSPNMLELKVRSIRLSMQPYLAPMCSAYNRVNDFVSTGVAHSQNAIHRLSDNRNSLINALIISGSGLFGVALARRRGFFKKVLFGSLFFGAAGVACYPKEAQEKSQVLLYIAKNKFPVVAKQQYEKLIKLTTNATKQTDQLAPQKDSEQGPTVDGPKK